MTVPSHVHLKKRSVSNLHNFPEEGPCRRPIKQGREGVKESERRIICS